MESITDNSCNVCEHFSECLMTGYEMCKLGKDIPNSKRPCDLFELNNERD